MEQPVKRLLTEYRELIDQEIRRLHAKTLEADRLHQVALDLRITRLQSRRKDVVQTLKADASQASASP
jgi:hypothetical protein